MIKVMFLHIWFLIEKKMTVDLDNPLIMVTDQKINTIQEILPILEQVMQSNKPLFVDCR